MFRQWIIVSFGILPLFLLNACRERVIVQLPEGLQTITGILKPIPLSLTRRGTHVLLVAGKELYIAESSVVALTQYEGVEATFEGTLNPNTVPADPPVLTISKALSKNHAVREVISRGLRLRLEVPGGWRTIPLTGTGILQFSLSGSIQPLLTIARSPLKALPAGSPVLVDHERGVRLLPGGGSGDQIVYVQRGSEITSFTYTPGGLDPLLAPSLFLNMLRSVRFTGLPPRSALSGTGSMQLPPRDARAAPCGGPAGILCPDGSYCAITDTGENIGVCVKSTR